MQPEENWESFVLANPGFITYQLQIDLKKPLNIRIGRLGRFDFPAGRYIYTGSAKRNLVARIRRHLSKKKTIRWHIDYLLDKKDAQVTELQFFDQPECRVNQHYAGEVLIPGFGASDCKHQCGSHLGYLGDIN